MQKSATMNSFVTTAMLSGKTNTVNQFAIATSVAFNLVAVPA